MQGVHQGSSLKWLAADSWGSGVPPPLLVFESALAMELKDISPFDMP